MMLHVRFIEDAGGDLAAKLAWQTQRVPFFDGMIVDADGRVVNRGAQP